MNWHCLGAEQVLEDLGVPLSGLSAADIVKRRAECGPNVLTTAKPRSPISLFLAQFADFMILVLIGAAVVSGAVGDFTDTVVIIAIVVLNGVIGFVQEYRAEQALQALKAMAAPSAVRTTRCRGTGRPRSDRIRLVSSLSEAMATAMCRVSEVTVAWMRFWCLPWPNCTRL